MFEKKIRIIGRTIIKGTKSVICNGTLKTFVYSSSREICVCKLIEHRLRSVLSELNTAHTLHRTFETGFDKFTQTSVLDEHTKVLRVLL